MKCHHYMVLITSNHNKFDNNGNRLSLSGAKTIKPDNIVSDVPYTEIKEFIQGYIIVKTADINEAVELAKGCSILKKGGTVELTAVTTPEDQS